VQVGADLITAPALTLAPPGVDTWHYTVVAVTASGLESVAAPAVVVSVPGL